MRDEIQKQREYWDSQYEEFDTIYSHNKTKLKVLLDRIFRKDMYQRFEFTIKNSEPIEGRSFLDVGCGTGLYSIELAKKGAEHVLGLDIAENMVQISREYALRNNVQDKCDFLQSDLLEFKSSSTFDLTIGIGLFDYIEDALPVIKKMREMTKDKIILSFPRLFTWRAPVRKLRLSIKHCDVYFYTKKEILKLMKEAGFKDSYIEKVGKLYCVIGFC